MSRPVPKTYLIEIKPSKQTIPPVPKKSKKKTTMIYEQKNICSK